MTHRLIPLCLALGLVGAAYAAPPEKSSVAYPTGYRKWAFVKSMVVYSDKHPLFAQFGGLHHVYANAEAMRALVKGGTFPDGSVLVLDLLGTKDESQTERLVTDATAQCFGCHQRQKDNDFAFSGYQP